MVELPPFSPEEQEPVYDYQIALDEITYRIVLQWRDRQASWYLSLYDASDNVMFTNARMNIDTPIGWRLTGRNIETGFIVLLDTEGTQEQCSYEDLGYRCQLFYFSRTEFADYESPYEISIAAVP